MVKMEKSWKSLKNQANSLHQQTEREIKITEIFLGKKIIIL